MTEFEIVEIALRRYQPVGPSDNAVGRIAAALNPRPLVWTQRWRLVAAGVLVLLAPLVWWGLQTASAPQAPPTTSVVPASFAKAWMTQPRVDLPGITTRADVAVVSFNDWLCPPCLQLYLALRPIFNEYARSHPGAVALIMLDWPWDARCNPHVSASGSLHKGACEAAVAVRAARDRGQGDVMVEWISANRDRLHGDDAGALIAGHAKALIPGLDFGAAFQALVPAIGRDVATGEAAKIQATPTLFINGVKMEGVPTAEVVDWAIRLELQRKKR